ncbi:hypothetical protein ACEWY4_022735 [Coilia grayii]|uniref:Fibronectin-like n=1 Tax=Coilia grayii TaxID=363190 RepID=A0ABD1J103_9TELE
MDADVSVAEGPLRSEGPDEVALAKERTMRKMEQTGDPSTNHTPGARGDPREQTFHHGRRSPEVSVISMKSDKSVNRHISFTGERKDTRVYLDQTDSQSSKSASCMPSEYSTPVDTDSGPHTVEPGAVLCAVCPKRAFKSCLTCMASFCELHVKPHYTAPALQRHRLVEATEALDQRLCQQHNRELELYCNTDQTAMCVMCVVKGHMGHSVTDLGEYQEKQISKPEVNQKTAAVPPPGLIEFTSVKPDSVCLCWGPPEGLAGPHTFRVSWMGASSKEQLEVQGQDITVQELMPGEEYTFTVTTLSHNGIESPCVSATTCTDVPPPESLAVGVGVTSASVTWSKSARVHQASYLMTLHSGGGCIDTISVRSLQHSFRELDFGGEYTINVSTVLNGRQSKPVSRTFRTSIPVPENVTVGSVTPTSANLSWSLHQGMEQIPHGFLISYCSEGTEPQTISTKSGSVTFTGLQPDTQYRITVCCELKYEERRSEVTPAIIQTAVSPPGPIEFTSVKPDSVCLCWGPPEGLTGPHTFRVSWTGEGRQEQLDVRGLKVQVQELTPGEEYTFTVATLSDEGRQSPCVSATVGKDVPVPENVTVSSVTPTSADLSWSLQQGMEQIPHRFLFSYCSKGTEPQTISTQSCSTSLTGLQPDTQYWATVCCELKDGRKSEATSTRIQTAAVPPPGPIEFTSVKPDSVCLCWGPPEGLTGPHTFRVSWTGAGRQETLEVQDQDVTVQGLTPGEEYTFTVATLSDEGRESPCGSATARTGIPVPENVTVGSVTRTSADLSWSLHQCMEQIPHRFLISYCSEGTEPQTISTQSCSTTLKKLQSDTEYTVSICTELQSGEKTETASITLHTSVRQCVIL